MTEIEKLTFLDIPVLTDLADDLAKKTGIHVVSYDQDKQLIFGYILNGALVACLWGTTSGVGCFDVCVDEDFRRNGLARNMVRRYVEQFEQITDGMSVDLVDRNLQIEEIADFLRDVGFTQDSENPNIWTRQKPTETQ